ncbi:class F sortase [Streptomyces sp. AK08-02]|uniref:class F sortase n=1 Tax=Streptomyces sp. AK08-02 TaxID=3028654 RepID=UPI0029AAC961|nr:class F sortase [Streptomyces sp. AK08-02]MDX3752354.1 class F sortase [Streptomyces sp. AK08-02]
MRRFTDILIAALTVTALCSGAWLVRSGGETHAPPQPSAAQARTRPTHPESSHPESPTPTLPPSPPLRIRIPAIGVDAPLMGLGLTATGSLDVPPAERENLAGWYEDGTVPGGTGTAIVAGHVDNADGPSVFYRLGALEKGGGIEVERLDGSTARFTVDAVEVYDTENFPDEKVYGAAKRAELRVITCGGRYSRSTGYQGNVVVFAHLTGSRRE